MQIRHTKGSLILARIGHFVLVAIISKMLTPNAKNKVPGPLPMTTFTHSDPTPLSPQGHSSPADHIHSSFFHIRPPSLLYPNLHHFHLHIPPIFIIWLGWTTWAFTHKTKGTVRGGGKALCAFTLMLSSHHLIHLSSFSHQHKWTKMFQRWEMDGIVPIFL